MVIYWVKYYCELSWIDYKEVWKIGWYGFGSEKDVFWEKECSGFK